MKMLLLNGPNLSRLDLRDSSIYGDMDFEDLKVYIQEIATSLDIEVDIRQSDSESEIIHWLHQASDNAIPVIFNPAAFTHYSYAIRDAAEMLKAPLIEVHLSNPMAREEFRHTSVISGIATGTIAGFGPDSYRLALLAMVQLIS
jgi:3-dehydroquinate dehydratase-2